jgi:hypothetical protein
VVVETFKWIGPDDDPVWAGVELTLLYNADFAGDVHLILPPTSLQKPFVGKDLHPRVAVPYAALRSLVAEQVRQAKILLLEDAEDEEVLGA